LFAEVVDDTLRARLFTVDVVGNLGALIFDTTTVVNDAMIHRHKGRAGWFARLYDGDAYIAGIRPRSVGYGEYVSLPFYSDTPVMGAQLAAHFSPPLELVSLVESSDWGGEVSGQAPYAIAYDRTSSLQGFQTNNLTLDDLRETEISFDLKLPVSTPAVIAFLYSEEDRYIQLNVTPSGSGQWEHFNLPLASYYDTIQTGLYKLVLLTPSGATWYVDNLSCAARVVAWDGRSNEADPWGMDSVDWMPFLNTLNGSGDGLVFPSRGDQMQIRARAMRQAAQIIDIAAQPKYAELGNFNWRDQAVTWQAGLSPSFTTGISGRTVTCTSTSTSTGSPIIAYLWSFGDGSINYGPASTHVFSLAGTYPITLTVIDSLGQRVASTSSVTVA
jgi:hypothetical protein